MLITLIGCGKMGSAMLQGWLNDAALDADFAIVEPHHDALAWTSSYTNVRLFDDCAARRCR
jgi:pyrroline-5-carboxylate reductase